jgi:hypothetical protein
MAGAVKSIIDVEVDGGAFKKFHADFNKYMDDVKKMPGLWGRMDKASRGALEREATGFAVQMNMLRNVADIKRKIEDQDRKGVDTSRKQADNWGKIAQSGKNFATSVLSAGASIAKWAAFGLAGGLLGAGGGLWGISRLAANASDTRRSALGMGISFGQKQAFGATFGRLVDPDSYLQSVFEAQSDISKRWTLYGAGISDRQMQGKNAAQIGVDLLTSLKKIADTTPQQLYGQVLQARGLSQFASANTLQLLHGTNWGELGGLQKQFGPQANQMNVNARRWADFNTALETTKFRLESVFLKALDRLTVPLGKLSSSFEGAVEAFMMSDMVKKWISDLGTELEKLAAYMQTEQFQKDLQNFFTAIGKLGNQLSFVLGAMADFATWVYKNIPGAQRPEANPGLAGSFAYGVMGQQFFNPATGKPTVYRSSLLGLEHRGESAWPAMQRYLEEKHHLPAGTMATLFKMEGVWDKQKQQWKDSPAGAFGPFQFMPGTAAQYGINRFSSFEDQAEASAAYMEANLKKFHGDLEKAAVGYNMSPDRLAAIVKKYGADWKNHLPKNAHGEEEAKSYSEKWRRLWATDPEVKAAQTTVKIDLNNNSSADPTIQVGMGAYR